MGSMNGIIGDDAFGTQLPETQLDEQTAREAKRAISFAKSAEFKELKRHLQSRIDFYQTYLPDGRAVVTLNDNSSLGSMWVAANAIIGEFNAIIQAYEQAAEASKHAITK